MGKSGGSDRKWKGAIAALIAFFMLASLYILTKEFQLQHFHAPSNTQVKTKVATTNKDVDSTATRVASSFHRPITDSSETRGDNLIFPGAEEWYDYWTYASRKGRDSEQFQLDQTHIHDEYVVKAVEEGSDAALNHINEMRQRYESVGALADFYARGLGWIQDRLGMVLTVVVAGNFTTSNVSPDGTDGNIITLHPGPTSIFIVDTIGQLKCVGGGDKDTTWMNRQPPLTMWVRANGKSSSPTGTAEIFAGTPLPHKLENSDRCAWRYDFYPRYPGGMYSIHVKVLNFNGFMNPTECKTEDIAPRNNLFDNQNATKENEVELGKLETMNYDFVTELAEQGNYSHHRGVSGFKMYSINDACCEACTRARGCRRWSTPGALHFDECELYFSEVQEDVNFADRDDGHYLGRDRTYSYTRQQPSNFPNRRKLAIAANELGKAWWPTNARPTKGQPRSGAVTYFIGCGWSTLMSFENPCHYPSDDVVFGSGKKVELVGHPQNQHSTLVTSQFAGNVSRSCLLDDEKLDTSNGRWVRHPYPSDSVCLPMVRDTNTAAFKYYRPLYRGDRPNCWHRDDLTQGANTCAEPGCRFLLDHRWVTDLKRESKWFGLWESNECLYHDLADEGIQQCVDSKHISSIELQGASIKNLVIGYMNQKLQNITMVPEGNSNGTLSVVVNTLKMPHLVWHLSIEEYLEELHDITKFPDVTNNSDYEHYWITGFYYTSEREPHAQVDRSLQYSKMAWETLTRKGYKMINAFDVTAAFAYDTDGQADGLHIGGPPTKAIITKFFHHLCHDVLY